MNLDLTFKDLCSTIKMQGKEDPKLIEAVDKLLGLALICSPVVLGPAALALLPTLAVKNEVFKIGKGVFEKLTKKKDEDYSKRQETMQISYGLLVFTAFFDALDARIPKALRDEIGLLDPEKAFLVKDAVAKAQAKKSQPTVCDRNDAPVSNVLVAFPHPTETLAEITERQAKLWKQMAQGFLEFIQKLAFWEKADEKKQIQLLAGIDKIEEEAAKLFEAQYFELARKFEDFAVWSNLQEHKNTKALICQLSDYVQQHATLSAANEKAIDVGFSKLHAAVLSMPETLRTTQATELADSLNKHYRARINDPIIEDKEPSEDGKPRLSFPRVCDAFVPQAFRVLRQHSKLRRLEEESTWSELPRRNDLGAFLLSYLSSPYSTETPLLILGHPGSGKSLLTTLLSAQLMSKHFTAIRVPLREVNADADIVSQIEDAIRRITGVSVDSWIKLSALFKNCPPLVILDGYDELLQASGQVFASYIKDAQRFQEREAEQGRPLRIIITSRVTLIDKAAVPVGSTIVRLLEFDKHQRDCWSAIWNKSNASYFSEASIEKFTLPAEKDSGSEKILTLAEQPLLLLMLALYDSEGNQLRQSKGLDRTKLYDSLLRRFVTRERGKEKGFSDGKSKERDKALGIEMQRLGVAALGMYNRRKVHILAPELDDDLGFFKLEREVAVKSGKTLSQADLLLGSFFFIHKSKAQHNSGADDTHEDTSAFEFLHNTFGEFLTADFILRRAVAQVKALRAFEVHEALRAMFEKMMGTADGFERDWFASLVYTPLFTRPVIMEMIREWAPHVLKEQGLTEGEFVESLEMIVLNQIKRLLNKREMPSIIRRETAQEGYRVPFGDHPLIGHVAIYSMNLVLLRLVVGAQSFVFDEAEVASHEDGTRPWDRLIHIWRSWFALGNLNGLTAVMLTNRTDSKITVTAKKKFQAEESKSRLQDCLNVAMALGDNVASGLSGLFLFDPSGDSASDLNKIEQRLTSEGIDLELAISIKRLLVLAAHFPDAIGDFARLGSGTIQLALKSGRRDELEQVCLTVARALDVSITSRLPKHDPRPTARNSVFRDMVEPRMAAEVAIRDARSGRILWALGRQLCDHEWQREFSHRFLDFTAHKMPMKGIELGEQYGLEWFRLMRDIGGGMFSEFVDRRGIHPEMFERIFHPRQLLELSERNPEGALAYVQLLREIGGGRFLERYSEKEMGPEFFERMFHPKQLLELSERNPEGALAYLQLVREIGGDRFLERYSENEMGPEFFERMFQPRQLIELSERNPEGALAYVQLLREIGGGRLLGRYSAKEMGPKFFERLFHPRQLLELTERNPEQALVYVRLLRELGGGRLERGFLEKEMHPEFFEQMFHPRYLLELSERNPEGALAYIQILREFGGDRFFERHVGREMGPEFFEESFHSSRLNRVFDRKPAAIAVWLAFARLLKSRESIQPLSKAIGEFFRRRGGISNGLDSLPISTLSDLRWLADESQNNDLKVALAAVFGTPKP